MFCMGKSQADNNVEDLIAKKIENYIFKYDDLLGKGNFGQAYRGFDVNTGKQIAIKVVKMPSLKSKTSQKLLQNEIEILRKLPSHPNVLKCYDVFTSVNNCYIVTELCQQDLQKELNRKGKFKEHQIKQLIYGIYKGLEHLAKNYIVHRDIKISNIFLSKNGIPKIADFGFAITAKSNFKDANIGSPLYMSPQSLIYHQYGPKTDIWSFGVLIYELITGETPLEKCRTDQQLKNQILRPPFFPSFISPDLRQVIQKCLTVNELKRPSIFELGKFPYFLNLINEMEYSPSILKQGSNISTQCSLKIQRSFMKPSFFNKNLSYENGLSLLHYCRLLHKINVKYFDSKVFFNFLMSLSIFLSQASFLSTNVFNEQSNKLKQVLKEYHTKFLNGKKQHRIIMNPREMLTQIRNLMSQETSRNRIEALQFLDAETKVLIYSLEHQNPNILTKNSEAKIIIESGQLKI